MHISVLPNQCAYYCLFFIFGADFAKTEFRGIPRKPIDTTGGNLYILSAMAQQNTGTNKKSIIKAGLTLSVMTLASRIMGLLREMTKAAFLGTSGYADAFGIAFMIPNLFRRLFAENAISVAFIPTFKGYLEEDTNSETHAETQLFISSSLTLVSFLTAIITILGIAISPLIVPLFYTGETDAAFVAETIFLTRIMFPYLFVISAAAFLQGILNGSKIFAPSGFTPVLFNAIVIAVTYFLTPQLPNPHNLPQEAQATRAMSFGVLTGGCFQALFQWPFVKSTGWKTTLTGLKNAFTNPGTRKVVSLIVPTISGMAFADAGYQLKSEVLSEMADDGVFMHNAPRKNMNRLISKEQLDSLKQRNIIETVRSVMKGRFELKQEA